MLIFVASKNSQKLAAARLIFNYSIVHGFNVSSDVSDQPIGMSETYSGAANRMKNLENLKREIQFGHPDYFISFENGLVHLGDALWIDMAVVCIKDVQTGKKQFSTSTGVAVPFNPNDLQSYQNIVQQRTEKDICFHHTGGLISRTKNLSDALQIAYSSLNK